MDLGSIAKDFADAGLHVLGAALGGPAGNDVAGMIASHLGLENATPEKLAEALQDPAQLLKLRELNVNLAEARISADTQRIQAVNATMQAEAKAGRGDWRDFLGYIAASAFGIFVVAVVFLTYEGVTHPAAHALEAIPPLVNSMALIFAFPASALGITAYHAGKATRIQAGEKS